MNLPCERDKCIGKDCGNFGEHGCKGGVQSPWSWSKWYLEELPKIKEGNTMRKITQMENAHTALMKVESLIREDIKNSCDATNNQCIALGIISNVLRGKSWMLGIEVEEAVNG